jgi:hypothetical protein
MESQKDASLINRLSKKIYSLSIDRDDLHLLCDKLQERSNAAAELEVQNFKKGDQSDEEYEKNTKLIREAFILFITISGDKGEELSGSIDEIFNSSNFPAIVKKFYVNSEAKLRAFYNIYPRNSLELTLDFDKPKIFDLSLMPSKRTPNDSQITVKGYDVTWVNGVYHEISSFFSNKSSKFSFVHKNNIYDIFLWTIGLPFSFWTCFKLSSITNKINILDSVFLKNALYVYVFFASLFLLRIIFHYMRWVSPLVEYRSKTNIVILHRAILISLSISIFGTFLYDIIKFFL